MDLEARVNGNGGAGVGNTQELLTIREFAARVKLAPHTIQNRISSGDIKEGEGLVYVLGHPRIDWDVFVQFHTGRKRKSREAHKNGR